MRSYVLIGWVVMVCVQETGDGELVVLHDLHSVLAASQQFEVNQGIMAELAKAGLQPEAPATSTSVRKLSLNPTPAWCSLVLLVFAQMCVADFALQ